MEGAVKMQGVLSSGAGASKRTATVQNPSGTDDFLRLLQEKKDAAPQQEPAGTKNVNRENAKTKETSDRAKDDADADVKETPGEEESGKQEVLQQAVLAQQAALVITVMPETEAVLEPAADAAGVTVETVMEAVGEVQAADTGDVENVTEEKSAIAESATEGRMDIAEQAEERTEEDVRQTAGGMRQTAEIRPEQVVEQNRTVEPVKQPDRKPVTTEKVPENPEDGRVVQETAYHAENMRTEVREETAAPVERGTAEVPLKTTEQNLPEDLGKTLAARLPEAGRTLTVELEPASLGKLTIRLVYEGDRAAVSIMANNPRTLELLNQRASEIAAILEEKTGQETVIYTRPPEQNQEQPQDGRQGQGGQESRDDRQRNREKDRQQADSFAQQLRLGLV